MARKGNLPFTVGQEVEAKFDEIGYRGAWFRCRVLDIAAAEQRLLIDFLDFPDEVDTWARVRIQNPAIQSTGPCSKKKKTSIWMVRPTVPIVHERDVDKYREDVRVGRKCSGHVYIYNDMHMVGDMVDWWKDDCFWGAQIVEINAETNEAQLKLFLPPVGEGDGSMETAQLKDLRPSFSWNPMRQWRRVGFLKKGVENCKSNKPHIQRVYLSGDSMTSDDRCGPVSFQNKSYVPKSERNDLAINSRVTPGEERHSNSNSHALVTTSGNVYDRVKLRRTSTKSLIKHESPQEVKLVKDMRKVRFNSSCATSDEEDRTNPPGEPENIDGVLEHLRIDTAVRDSMNDSVATTEEDLAQVDFVVSATCSTPSNRKGGTVVPELVGEKSNLPVESHGSCLTTENADELGDQAAEVDGDGTSNVRPQTHSVVPENLPSPDSIVSVGRAQQIVTDCVTKVYDRKRRREKDQVELRQKRLCETNTYQGVGSSDGVAEKPLSSSVPGMESSWKHLGTHKSQNLRQPESGKQLLLLGARKFSLKAHAGLKRKQVENLDPGKDCKKMRADVSTAFVEEAVGDSPTPAEVELPRMRGSIKFSQEIPVKLRKSEALQKPSSQRKDLDAVTDRVEKLVNSVGFQQEQQCGHIEQKSVGKSPLSEFPTKCHLPSGSKQETPSLGKLGSEVLDKENRIILQPNGNWCIKDGRLVCTTDRKVGSSSAKEEFLSLYNPVNRFPIPKEKGPPPSHHTSSSCLREQAHGNHLSPALNEKLLKCTTLIKSIASKSSPTAVEPNVGSTVCTAKDVNESADDGGAPEVTTKVVQTREQEPSVISIKKEASVRTGSLFTTGDIQGGVQDKPIVKVEVSEPQPVGSAHHRWVHDTVKCRYGKDALDRVSMSNVETTEEIEVARQVKILLWRGLCCSPQSCGLGPDLFKRIQLLLHPRMHFEALADGKVLLSTGKPGEQIDLGTYNTDIEFDAARRIVSRCKKELQKSMVIFEASHKVQHVGTSKVSSSSLVEAIEHRSSASQAIGERSMQTFGREFGQSSTRTEISPKPSTAARASIPFPIPKQVPGRQTPVSSEAAAGPLQNVIVLDDDNNYEVHVIP